MAADIEALLGIGAGKQDLSAMAEALRRQQRGGQILALSPDKQISAMGTGMIDRAGSGATKMGGLNKSALQAEALRTQQDRQAGATKGYRDQQQQNWQANFEAEAAQREAKANKRGKAVQYWDKVTKEPMGTASQMDGSGLLVNTNDGTPYDPEKYTLKDPNKGRSAERAGYTSKGYKHRTAKQEKDLEESGLSADKVFRLVDDYRSEYAGGFLPVGEAVNALTRTVSGIAGPEMKAKQAWWSDFKSEYEALERHALYGGALTEPEIAQWKKGTISATMQDDQVRRKLALMEKVKQDQVRKLYKAANAKGYNQEVTDTYLGRAVERPEVTGASAGVLAGEADLSAVPEGLDPKKWASYSQDVKQDILNKFYSGGK